MVKNYKEFYERNGYLVVHNLIPTKKIDLFLKSFNKEIIQNKNLILPLMDSQSIKTPSITNNKLDNPIANIHCLKYFNKKFTKLNNEALKIILSNEILKILSKLHNCENFKLIMSMLFDKNTGTPAHQDCYYLDSFPYGNMTAAWIALQDISINAGRFYVISKSKEINFKLTKLEIKNPTLYEKKLYNMIINKKLKINAPYLKKGSVLFWNSGTIHGSLKTTDETLTRKSLTSHFIPKKYKFIRNRYSDEIRPVKGFYFKKTLCRVVENMTKQKRKSFSHRTIKTFNKQTF